MFSLPIYNLVLELIKNAGFSIDWWCQLFQKFVAKKCYTIIFCVSLDVIRPSDHTTADNFISWSNFNSRLVILFRFYLVNHISSLTLLANYYSLHMSLSIALECWLNPVLTFPDCYSVRDRIRIMFYWWLVHLL